MRAIARKRKSNISSKKTTDDWLSKKLLGQVPKKVVEKYLKKFHIHKELNDFVVRDYVEQFYIHLYQDLRTQTNCPIEVALQLASNQKEGSSIFYYILGFEILKMIFKMSWLQHERLYELQKNQESFIKNYIKPIQNTHRLNGIIVPKNESVFFAKRNYFVKRPYIKDKKLNELIMATFTTESVQTLGFLIVRHLNFLVFDYEYIFSDEPERLFLI